MTPPRTLADLHPRDWPGHTVHIEGQDAVITRTYAGHWSLCITVEAEDFTESYAVIRPDQWHIKETNDE
ncbi:hypothetical protein [Corynebacterium pygosceleis]|uniref:hypothetical protein n=1 Tax=Corynebacterium pygosceleis TaxID=2800406 RepID=UPI002002F00E|nr:hypothetical protein [Corynebacterium pygosceleis]MCK7676407.1 hypothetical protein [Corynebacterium pygosceleis]